MLPFPFPPAGEYGGAGVRTQVHGLQHQGEATVLDHGPGPPQASPIPGQVSSGSGSAALTVGSSTSPQSRQQDGQFVGSGVQQGLPGARNAPAVVGAHLQPSLQQWHRSTRDAPEVGGKQPPQQLPTAWPCRAAGAVPASAPPNHQQFPEPVAPPFVTPVPPLQGADRPPFLTLPKPARVSLLLNQPWPSASGYPIVVAAHNPPNRGHPGASPRLPTATPTVSAPRYAFPEGSIGAVPHPGTRYAIHTPYPASAASIGMTTQQTAAWHAAWSSSSMEDDLLELSAQVVRGFVTRVARYPMYLAFRLWLAAAR